MECERRCNKLKFCPNIVGRREAGEMAVGVKMVSLEKTKEINTESIDNDDVDNYREKLSKNMLWGTP